ncbi:MAG: DUF1800 domain-containing protein [Saprospiraceae bacterium]|nr:DUF1800 domain-containing protein [Saprospiraceae bacterium]
MPNINCAVPDLSAFVPATSNAWDFRKAMHLYRRIQFGADYETIQQAIQQDPVQLASSLVEQARTLPLPPMPVWAKWTITDYSPIEQERNAQIVQQILEWSAVWVKGMRTSGLRDRMSLFWHNHFVTKLEKYICPSWMYEYHSLLQKHALGNFKTFVREMGLTPAMLVYLDGIQNTRFQPNENFARELLELFTLGVDNGYTQQDIVNAAKAVSGWNGIDLNNLCGTVTFIPIFWDNGQKTIFGKTGNFGYHELIDLIFAERPVQVSTHICRKLYAHFVNPDVDEEVVSQLAAIFRQNNFEIAPVMSAMFSSTHFFDDTTIGTVIPGHLEYFISFLNEMDFPHDDLLMQYIVYGADEFDQRIFNPTDVAGWKGNRAWITSSTLPFRWEGITNIMLYYYQVQGNQLDQLRDLAISLSDAAETDPTVVCNAIIDYLLPNGFQTQRDYDEALRVFKAEVPENYFTTQQWNLIWEYAPLQVFLLIQYISTQPEFQLK